MFIIPDIPAEAFSGKHVSFQTKLLKNWKEKRDVWTKLL